jgi:hypothetical protein
MSYLRFKCITYSVVFLEVLVLKSSELEEESSSLNFQSSSNLNAGTSFGLAKIGGGPSMRFVIMASSSSLFSKKAFTYMKFLSESALLLNLSI